MNIKTNIELEGIILECEYDIQPPEPENGINYMEITLEHVRVSNEDIMILISDEYIKKIETELYDLNKR